MRRSSVLVLATAILAAVISGLPCSVASAVESAPFKIGVIGTGRIGGNLATLWAKAGHELVLSSRHPE